MKIKLYITLISALSVLVLFAAQGQTTNSNGSRLNMGQKRDASKIMANKSRTLFNIKTGTDRTIRIVPSKAINSYYRTVLLSGTATSTQSEIANVRNRTTNSEAVSVANESKNGTDVLKSEDQMFANDKITVRNVYPNPANDFADIDYAFTGNVNDAKILIYNVLLSSVGDYELNKNEKQLRVQTSDMPSGVYYYQLMLEGKKVATKKLIVRH
jgi:hypothetical protein